MWKSKEKAPIIEFVLWVIAVSLFARIVGMIFEADYTAGLNGGEITIGYIIYAINGMFIDTPTPMIAILIVLLRHKQLSSVKDFIGRVMRTPQKRKVVLVMLFFCGATFLTACLFGARNENPWYLFFPALPLMILGGGVEEIGWRGFLQPAMEKKFPYVIATLLTSVIWIVWHFPLWLIPSSNHYNDSMIGFVIWLLVWSFSAAAIYKVTKSVFCCVMYHAFINTIGSVFDWNQLFDAYPNQSGVYVYFGVILIAAVVLWLWADRKERA